MLMKHTEIREKLIDPATDAEVLKNVFIVFAHGELLLGKVKKISESIGATIYPVNENADQRRDAAIDVMRKIEELENVLGNTRATKRAELNQVADDLHPWQVILIKEKSLYHAMNKMNYDVNRKALIAEAWCPAASISTVKSALRLVTERTGSTIPPLLSELAATKTPPTSQRTNRVTSAFQGIVDAYGVAKYEEVNPGLYTVITFPFLFACMFGDFGHGSIVTIAAGYMVYKEQMLMKKKWGEIWDMFFNGRYIILLMGLFSIFTGLVYNDIFSQATTFFGSGYVFKKSGENRWTGERVKQYPFGIDPVNRI
jgi:V-type H+-transporting ATPase subunit a